MPVISISDSQRAPLPEAHWVGTVYNAVDTHAPRRSTPRGGSYLAWLGRISPEKGLDRAIRIAQRAGIPLKVGARLPLQDLNDPNVRADWEHYRARCEAAARRGAGSSLSARLATRRSRSSSATRWPC